MQNRKENEQYECTTLFLFFFFTLNHFLFSTQATLDFIPDMQDLYKEKLYSNPPKYSNDDWCVHVTDP